MGDTRVNTRMCSVDGTEIPGRELRTRSVDRMCCSLKMYEKISRDKSQYLVGTENQPNDGKKRLDGNANGGEKGKAKSN